MMYNLIVTKSRDVGGVGMKKLLLVFAFLLMLISSRSSYAAMDKFLGVPFNASYDQVQGLVKHLILDGNFSDKDVAEAAKLPTFHRGAEKVAGLPVGSVFWSFNKDTKQLEDAFCTIEFRKDIKSPTVEKFSMGDFNSDYYCAVYPYSEVEKYYDILCSYFTQMYGEPSSVSENQTATEHQMRGKVTDWKLFEHNIMITLDWYDIDPKHNIRQISFRCIRVQFPPEAEIFM